MIDKIRRGVLAVPTDCGVRYLQLSLTERLRLLWTFRNFPVLPEEVLHRHERALIAAVRRKGKYLANWNGHGDLSEHCIGTLERTNPRNQPAPLDLPMEHPAAARARTMLPRVS